MFDIITSKINEPIKKTSENGFHIYLSNSYKVSVQWGVGTYSDNHDEDFNRFYTPLQSTTAEIAVINPSGELIETPFSIGDTIIGWQTPDEIIKIVEWSRTLPDDKVCPWCGTPNDPHSKSCEKCGGPQRNYKH